jgi:hypothetical protein
MRHALGAARRFASHPLTLIAVGAVVSGFLIPAFTRGAQNHKQGLEIKSGIVDSISGSVSPFLAATLANELVYHGSAPRSYDLAYEQWDSRSAVVATKLRTYFGRYSDATLAWGRLRENMRYLYYLFRWRPAGGSPRESRREILHLMASFLSLHQCPSSGPNGSCTVAGHAALVAWQVPRVGINADLDFELRDLLMAFRLESDSIIDEVLAANPRL